MTDMEQWHGTTILGVKKGGKTVIAGDGQVTMAPFLRTERMVVERQRGLSDVSVMAFLWRC